MIGHNTKLPKSKRARAKVNKAFFNVYGRLPNLKEIRVWVQPHKIHVPFGA